jgi:hypothetical protein
MVRAARSKRIRHDREIPARRDAVFHRPGRCRGRPGRAACRRAGLRHGAANDRRPAAPARPQGHRDQRGGRTGRAQAMDHHPRCRQGQPRADLCAWRPGCRRDGPQLALPARLGGLLHRRAMGPARHGQDAAPRRRGGQHGRADARAHGQGPDRVDGAGAPAPSRSSGSSCWAIPGAMSSAWMRPWPGRSGSQPTLGSGR